MESTDRSAYVHVRSYLLGARERSGLLAMPALKRINRRHANQKFGALVRARRQGRKAGAA